MRILLHICCGVCSGAVVEQLRAQGHEVTGFFYNPNIHPEEEYNKRLDAALEMARKLDFPLIAGCYQKDHWLKLTDKLKDEPEGGKRCDVCFKLRIERSFRAMLDNDLTAFATTLTVSPHKDSKLINKIGWDIGRDFFLQYDFKKKDGFKKTMELAKTHGIYRQHYCGCVYSLPKS